MNKYLVLVSFDNNLGGAQIRYLSLFNEIKQRKNDYYLVLNRKLYELALQAGYIKDKNNRVVILEIDHLTKQNTSVLKENKNTSTKKPFYKIVVSHLLTVYKLIKYTYKLHLIFKKTRPSYVYSIWIGGMISWPLKYIYKFKMVYSYMDSGFSSLDAFWKHPLKCERLPLRYADTIDFLSKSLYQGVKKRINLKNRTKIAITPCSFKNYNQIFPAQKKLNTVVFCSRLTPIKNPMLFLQSIKIFNNNWAQANSITFQVLGDGSCLNEMQVFIEQEQLRNVQLKGQVDNPVEFLKKSKIFISIQQTNNYPSQSLLEAMACENAIIASDVGETRKLVSEQEGILVSLDAKEIAQAMIELFENENKRITYGKKARQKVLEEHSVETYLEHFYSLEN